MVETPQYWLLRVACGLSRTPAEAIGFYRLMSSLAYLPSSPTLFNSGTRHTQMSSCYLVDSPARRARLDLRAVRAGGASCRSSPAASASPGRGSARRGALIRGTNGQSNGIVPWLRTLDASVAAVNQGGRRKGAACVYLEPWHPDIEEFLELRDNTGEDARRTHNLNLANWIPDEFMRRVEADEVWSLIDPDEVPELPDLWGEEFDAAYRAAEAAGPVRAAGQGPRPVRPDDAHPGADRQRLDDVQGRRPTALCNQTARAGQRGAPVQPVHRDRRGVHATPRPPCATSARSTSPRTSRDGGIDWERLRATVRTAVHVPRPGDRHQLLPEPRGGGVQPALAAGRARA